MSYHVGFWLRAMKVRLLGNRASSAGTAVRQKDKRRRHGHRPSFEGLEPRITPAGMTTFAPGAYIVDMGQTTQTVGNAMKPYGLVYDMVTNFKVPVNWAINPAKTTYAFNSPATSVDFTATITTGTKSYGGDAGAGDDESRGNRRCTWRVRSGQPDWC